MILVHTPTSALCPSKLLALMKLLERFILSHRLAMGRWRAGAQRRRDGGAFAFRSARIAVLRGWALFPHLSRWGRWSNTPSPLTGEDTKTGSLLLSRSWRG